MRRILIGRKKRSVALLFMAAMAAGMIIMNMGKSTLLEETGLLDEYTLNGIRNLPVDKDTLFYFVMGKRMGSALFLIIFSTTYLGYAGCVLFTAWYGVTAGAYLAALVLRYGMKGLSLAAAGLFPQYLVYIPVFYLLVLQCQELHRSIYLDRYGSADGASVAGFFIKKALRLFLLLLAVGLGCVLESFVNPSVVISMLRRF